MRKRRLDPMPSEFNVLASYNTEVAHGIVHTPEWKSEMAILQARYDEWAASTAPPGYTAITRVRRSNFHGDAPVPPAFKELEDL